MRSCPHPFFCRARNNISHAAEQSPTKHASHTEKSRTRCKVVGDAEGDQTENKEVGARRQHLRCAFFSFISTAFFGSHEMIFELDFVGNRQ